MERIGLNPGDELGGYRIVAPLGSGGMGTVYRAEDVAGNAVALKLLRQQLGGDTDARARLAREVAALQRLRHPGVVRVWDAELDSSEAFVVTELVDGPDLEEFVRDHGPLNRQALASLAAALHDALEAVHAADVVHRDVKPANVLMTVHGPVLIDFGIAQASDDARLTQVGLVAGTPGYLAPELLDGAEPSAASDWWGWAAVLAFAGTGRPPFGSGSTPAVLARVRSGLVQLGGLPKPSAVALRAALAADPAYRAQSEELLGALRVQADSRLEPVDLENGIGDGASDIVPLAGLAPDAGLAPTVAGLPVAQGLPEPTRVLPESTRLLPESTRVLPGADGPAADGAFRDLAPESGPDSPADLANPADEGYQPPVARHRVGSLLALFIAVCASAALRPGWAAMAALAGLLVFRTVGSNVAAVHARRASRGERSSDRFRAVLASPWHLLRAIVGLLPSVVVGASVAIVIGGVGWWAVASERVVVPAVQNANGTAPGGANEPWVYSVLVALALGAGVLAAWLGPASARTRSGARWTLGALAPGRPGAVVVVVGCVALAAFVAVLVLWGREVVWWPIPGAPTIR